MYVARASRFFFARPPAVPTQRVYSHPVYALKASDMANVAVSGPLVVRGQHLLTPDEAEFRAKAREYAAQVSASERQ